MRPELAPRTAQSLALACALLAGCGGSSIFSGSDAGSSDGGTGAHGAIGAACGATSDCASGLACIAAADGFPDGYCSEPCLGTSCPSAASCADLGATPVGASACLAHCTSDADCRSGYVCCLGLEFTCAPDALCSSGSGGGSAGGSGGGSAGGSGGGSGSDGGTSDGGTTDTTHPSNNPSGATQCGSCSVNNDCISGAVCSGTTGDDDGFCEIGCDPTKSIMLLDFTVYTDCETQACQADLAMGNAFQAITDCVTSPVCEPIGGSALSYCVQTLACTASN